MESISADNTWVRYYKHNWNSTIYTPLYVWKGFAPFICCGLTQLRTNDQFRVYHIQRAIKREGLGKVSEVLASRNEFNRLWKENNCSTYKNRLSTQWKQTEIIVPGRQCAQEHHNCHIDDRWPIYHSRIREGEPFIVVINRYRWLEEVSVDCLTQQKKLYPCRQEYKNTR